MYLGDEVTAIYRPDIEEVAYYEFEVRNSAEKDRTTGFIVVSAADHDHPISHWSLNNTPVSSRLAESAKKKRKNYRPRLLKLCVLHENGHEGEKHAKRTRRPYILWPD